MSKKVRATIALTLSLGLALAFSLPTFAGKNKAAAPKTIVQTAIAAGSFKTLVAAVKGAKLVGALSGKGPFTVFAPTDAAFAKLPKGTVASLLKTPKKLAGILTYHVISGNVKAATAITLNGKTVKTLNGATIKITVRNGKVFINNAQVTATDIACSNGTIHVIDSVILPPAPKKTK